MLQLFNFLSTSGEEGLTPSTAEERTEAIVEKVEKAGTHVIFDNQEVAAWVVHTRPELKYKAGYRVVSCVILTKIIKRGNTDVMLRLRIIFQISLISFLETSSLISQQKFDKVCLFNQNRK